MESLVITNDGNELITKMLAGETKITFTKIAVSDFDYSGINVKNIGELQQIRQIALVSKISRLDGNTVEVLAAVENRQVTESYFVRALGVYAENSKGNEVLYGVSISTENCDYMPSYDGKVLSGISYRLNIVVADSEQVTINVNPGAVATVMQIERLEEGLKEHIENHTCHVTQVEREKWNSVTDLEKEISYLKEQSKTTVFNDDGSITEKFDNGMIKKITFNNDSSITEKLTKDEEVIKTKTTIFNTDGSIKEVVEWAGQK